jgi:hypothetical protein
LPLTQEKYTNYLRAKVGILECKSAFVPVWLVAPSWSWWQFTVQKHRWCSSVALLARTCHFLLIRYVNIFMLL